MKDFVSKELAKIAKENDFNEPVYGYYDDKFISPIVCYLYSPELLPEKYFPVPMYLQLVDWFFRIHKLCISSSNTKYGTYNILGPKVNITEKIHPDCGYGRETDVYEVLNVALIHAFKLINK